MRSEELPLRAPVAGEPIRATARLTITAPVGRLRHSRNQRTWKANLSNWFAGVFARRSIFNILNQLPQSLFLFPYFVIRLRRIKNNKNFREYFWIYLTKLNYGVELIIE